MDVKFDYDHVPTIREFALSDAFIRGLMGPFGSGKSSGCVTEFVNRGHAQAKGPDGVRRTRWAVVRNTIPQLNDTTIRTFFQWLPPEYFGKWHATDRSYEILAFPGCHIEILFRALDDPDDVRKLLSLDLTGAWVNEAREVPWAVVEALQGRLGRYPARKDGGPTWYGMWLDTNAPDTDSRWYKFFEEESWRPSFNELKRTGVLPADMDPDSYVRLFKQPSGLATNAENIENLPKGYYQQLAIGKTSEWIKVYIHGEYGFVSDNKGVFSELFRESTHVRAIEPIEGRTVYRGWDFGLCYDDQTEVLTERGWKFFKDVDCDVDLIASRDPATGAFEYAKAAFKVAKPYKGEMLEWSSTELNVCVTPEHRVPYTIRSAPNMVRWASAEELAAAHGKHHYVDLRSTWEGRAGGDHWIDKGDRYGLEEPTVFAEFMGLYLSEGSVDLNRVTIYQRQQRPDMQRILDATGLLWKWRGGDKGSGWRVYHPPLAEYLRQFGKAPEKFVPFHVRMMPPAQIRAFIAAYTLGDGHVRKRANGSVEHTLFTTSKRMADDMQELAQKAGWNSSLRIVKPQVSVLKGREIVNAGGFSITFKKASTRAELFEKNFRRVAYDGIVYCLNVPHHTLYVRRHGKPSWNGNTPACTYSQVLPDGRWLVFDEQCAQGMGIDRFSDDVLDHCSRAFRGHADFEDIGDPAGNDRVQTDEKTCFEILQGKGINIRGGQQSLTIRLESIRRPLTRLVGGEPQFILHPRCKVLRKGFLGAYYYRRMQVNSEKYSSKPEKNDASHPMDSLEYVATELFGGGLTDPQMEEQFPQMERSTQGKSRVTGY